MTPTPGWRFSGPLLWLAAWAAIMLPGQARAGSSDLLELRDYPQTEENYTQENVEESGTTLNAGTATQTAEQGVQEKLATQESGSTLNAAAMVKTAEQNGQEKAAGLGTTLNAAAAAKIVEQGGKEKYVENFWLQDFEVHFLISIPFTAMYSYVSILALDGMVQGSFPPRFYQADMWMVIGAAVGSSIAIALGSINRVPDQTQYQLKSDSDGYENREKHLKASFLGLEFVKIEY